MNCASFRAGVMTTYLRFSDMLTGITDELFIGAGDWNRPVSPGGPRRVALYPSPACSYLARNNLICTVATQLWAKHSSFLPHRRYYAVRSATDREIASVSTCLRAAREVKSAISATTRACCSAFSCGNIGRETISAAAFSATGKSPRLYCMDV